VHFGESENFEGTKNPLREGEEGGRECPQKVEKSGDNARKIGHKPRKKGGQSKNRENVHFWTITGF
jgi:hypothetical protein